VRPGGAAPCPAALQRLPLQRVVLGWAIFAAVLWCAILSPARESAMPPPKRARHATGSSEPEPAATTLRLLLVGDVHDRVDRLQQLAAELQGREGAGTIDAVLLDGDLANVPRPDAQNPQESEPWLAIIADQIAVMDELMSERDDDGGKGGKGKVYYVPGNHDPPQLFSAAGTEAAAALGAPGLRRGRNVHGAATELAPNLFIAGLGGSTPARRGGVDVWSGFPYATEAEAAAVVEDELRPAISSAVAMSPRGRGRRQQHRTDGSSEQLEDEEEEDGEPQLLLLTHVGPDGAGTARVWRCASIFIALLSTALLSAPTAPSLLPISSRLTCD
jgi:hypothetical protein